MEDSDYSLADFNTWKVNALKAYLSKRNLKVEGNKATLVAIAFAAWEMKVPLAETNVQLEIEKKPVLPKTSYNRYRWFCSNFARSLQRHSSLEIWKRRHERLAPSLLQRYMRFHRHAGKDVGMRE
jgi:hypothetical protein